jgi:hypothetical protein
MGLSLLVHSTYHAKEPSMQPQLSPAAQRHLQRYAQEDESGFKNTPSEQRLLALGLIERCDTIRQYTATLTWTVYKARITPAGRQYLLGQE